MADSPTVTGRHWGDPRVLFCGHRFQLRQGIPDHHGETSLIARIDPERECDFEHGDPRLCRQCRRGVTDSAATQSLGDRLGQGGHLDQLALLQARIRTDHRLPLARVFDAALENTDDGVEGRRDGVDGGHRFGRSGNGVGEERLQTS